jgi:hypothetical protein
MDVVSSNEPKRLRFCIDIKDDEQQKSNGLKVDTYKLINKGKATSLSQISHKKK